MIIRWISEDGKRKWLYPIKKDVYTKGKILKQISKEAKVIGITKVNIPSPMHPIIPYYILLLEDEHGNRMPKKVMKPYRIGDSYHIAKAKTNGAVIITKIKYDIEEYVKESLRLVRGFEAQPEDKIFIKVSCIEPAYGYQAITTNPKVLDAVLSYLKEKKVTDVIVGEQAFPGYDVAAAAKKSGIYAVCEYHEVPFVDLGKSEYVTKSTEGISFQIAKEVTERKVINVPVMKTHMQIGIAGAMENMIRITNTVTQNNMYDNDIEKTLPLLMKTIPSFLTIGDATIGLQGNGPTLLGEPAFLNMVFVSNDPVALDTIFGEMGMLSKPNYLVEAAAQGIGNANEKKIECVGDELEAIKFQLRAAEQVTAHPNIMLIDGKANPTTFAAALKVSSKLFGLLGHKLHLVIGKHLTEDMVVGYSRLVAFGGDAIQRLKELHVAAIAEIPENKESVEQIMLLKSILENPEKKSLSATDKVKSKLAKFGMNIKKAIQ